MVISAQEEKAKVFASLCDWENELLIETEKPGEISSGNQASGKVNNKPFQARWVQDKVTMEHLR